MWSSKLTIARIYTLKVCFTASTLAASAFKEETARGQGRGRMVADTIIEGHDRRQGRQVRSPWYVPPTFYLTWRLVQRTDESSSPILAG